MNIHSMRSSITGPRGNTVYTGRVSVQGGERSASAGVRAVDLGSDGSIDAAFGRAAVNGEMRSIWGAYGSHPLGPKESFQATIKGDPHFTVDGSVNGQEVSTKFDNQDLGERVQYAGAGFSLKTDVVPWGSDNGAAVVDSATVNTGFGKNKEQVTVNSDGSVTVGGQAVSLENGDSMNLNRTSELSRNDDGSYTVSSRNGKVTNNLSVHENEKGNYINIESSVDNVQTVGWLQNQG